MIDIENETVKNEYYRRVIGTGEHLQLVLMSLLPNEAIPRKRVPEVHDGDQFIRVEKGKGVLTVNGNKFQLYDGVSATIYAGEHHLIENVGDEEMKIYTLYSPPEHSSQKIEMTDPNTFGKILIRK